MSPRSNKSARAFPFQITRLFRNASRKVTLSKIEGAVPIVRGDSPNRLSALK